MDNRQILEQIYNDKIFLEELFNIITTNKNSLNIVESVGLLCSILKNASTENLRIPTIELTDEVTLNTQIDETQFKNTLLGEILLRNYFAILSHFNIENDGEKQGKIEGTFGETYVPLGLKRYLNFKFFYNFSL